MDALGYAASLTTSAVALRFLYGNGNNTHCNQCASEHSSGNGLATRYDDYADDDDDNNNEENMTCKQKQKQKHKHVVPDDDKRCCALTSSGVRCSLPICNKSLELCVQQRILAKQEQQLKKQEEQEQKQKQEQKTRTKKRWFHLF